MELKELKTPQEVKLGDGHTLEGTAEGTVRLETLLPDGKHKSMQAGNCTLCTKAFLQPPKCLQGSKCWEDDKI